jgi:hypothetical protein
MPLVQVEEADLKQYSDRVQQLKTELTNEILDVESQENFPAGALDGTKHVLTELNTLVPPVTRS